MTRTLGNRTAFAAGMGLLLLVLTLPLRGQGGDRYALLIGGLGGEERFTESFGTYLYETRRALVESFGVPAANVTVLGETKIASQPYVDDVSTADNVRAAFRRLAARAKPEDQVLIVLFGHGSYDGTLARLNMPREDLSDADFAALVDGLTARSIVFVNTASASGPFAKRLSGPNRVVIAATRAGSQRNATVFPEHFVAGLGNPEADLDRDGDLTVLELFRYAAGQTDRFFTSSGTLATEFAMLEDTGDGEAARLDDLDASGEGGLAAVTYLKRGFAAAGAVAASNPALTPYLIEREELERAIAGMKARKTEMNEDAYYAELERLFVRLARLNERIEG